MGIISATLFFTSGNFSFFFSFSAFGSCNREKGFFFFVRAICLSSSFSSKRRELLVFFSFKIGFSFSRILSSNNAIYYPPLFLIPIYRTIRALLSYQCKQ